MATCHIRCMRLPGSGVVHYTEGCQWCPHPFAGFQDVAMYCNQPVPPKWIYGLYYLVLTKLTLTKRTSGLKGSLQRDCWVEGNTESTDDEGQENGRADVSPTHGTGSSSATLWGTNNGQLIKSDKKLAKKKSKLPNLSIKKPLTITKFKYEFTSAIVDDEAHPRCILCFEKLASGGKSHQN